MISPTQLSMGRNKRDIISQLQKIKLELESQSFI